MRLTISNNSNLCSRKIIGTDFALLHTYLNNLTSITKSRFGPHPFDLAAIEYFYTDTTNIGYIAIDENTKEIIAYAIIKKGFLKHDAPRLAGYGLFLNDASDATFAPSVADTWQSKGIGQFLFQFIQDDLQAIGIKRIILWGGVQKSNEQAVRFYQKLGFRSLGEFEYNDWNVDMVLMIDK
jgi:diamine N-acetyltransferase